ncbi:DNA protecting protein DprA [Thalassoporum mexicanum PCC 7367]|uniref:DNA-processing protein DprA n=1 Tax=Thalassoporum mexicanum TaxID=3457544 RepID=UPI00029FDD9E|nr:DNA-processing protein DprA [Pseudanabaena sp. PCC 7367]AFY71769.1 DNA protecting protein DprA [Pseudanabaena sp. PCC 7367]
MTERAYWLAWSQVEGVGPITMRRLQQQFGSLRVAWGAQNSDLRSVQGIGTANMNAIATARKFIQPEQLLQDHLRQNPRFWTPSDPEYPKLLLEIPDPPALLYGAGKITIWDQNRAIAVVGTRHPSAYGVKWARKIGRALAVNGFTVVSGLADGIDGEAHRGCLDAKGQTIAVVGTGVDRVFPSANYALHQQILRSGLILSEYPYGTEPGRANFPRRNRIIAGLCRATIIIEAPRKSGALITAHQANEYNRDVYALPNSLDFPQGQGCLDLISRGAQLIMSEKQLIEALEAMPRLDPIGFELLSESNDSKARINRLVEAATQAEAQRMAQTGNGRKSSNSRSGSSPNASSSARRSTAKSNSRSNSKAAARSTANNKRSLEPQTIEVIVEPVAEIISEANKIDLPPLSKLQEQLMDLLDPVDLTSFDAIVQKVNQDAGEISAALLELELYGAVAQAPGMHYQRLV